MSTILIHNARCSKSRQALRILEESGLSFETFEYLKVRISENMLAKIYKYTKEASPWGFIRKKEPVCKELGLHAETPPKELLKAIFKNPILLERPILIHNLKAVVGRPPEKILEII
jgi:arsenate reductase